jgi:hypothetical protein
MAAAIASLSAIESVDALHEVKNFAAAFEAACSGVSADGGADCANVELLWRSARAHYDASGDPDIGGALDAESCLREGLALSVRAKGADPEHWGGHKWEAICLAGLTPFISKKEAIGNSYHIRASLDRAREILPTDATINHALGSWCFRVANLGWAQRALANTFLATVPTSTNEEALVFFEAAAASYSAIHTCIAAADVCEKLRKTDDAQGWLRRAVEQEAVGVVENAQQAEAAARLKA